MAVSLISEVMAFVTGSDLAPTERFVLVAIAEQANAKTRQAWQESGNGGRRRWNLAEAVGLSPTGLRDVLQRLAKRGLEVRVPLSKDSKGRVVYAVHGRQTTYRLPGFPRRDGDAWPSPYGDGGALPPDGEPSPYGDGQAPPPDGQPSPPDGQPSPYPSVSRQSPNSNAREPRHIVMDNTDAKSSEADAVVARISNEVKPRSLGGFLTHLAKSGELQQWVAEARAAGVKADLAEANARRQAKPECGHGVAGGDQLHPTSGEPWCPQCRRRYRAERLNRTADPPAGDATVTRLDSRRPA